ncbi:hypothetical protein C8Q74DRAFT_1278844 [Fomes fomentarius]|nr:hypothetical protein C8Q74DRAFT_1278844 [Fomes fomentarius]
MQALHYFAHYIDDPLHIKVLKITAFLVQSPFSIWSLRLYIVMPIVRHVSVHTLALSTLDALDKLNTYAITMNATGAAADVAIAAVMCTLLHIHKSGLQRSDMIVNKVVCLRAVSASVSQSHLTMVFNRYV